MSSSTRSRLILVISLVLAVLTWREVSIRRHEADLDDWPRVGAT